MSIIFQWRSLKTRLTLSTLIIFLISIWSLACFTSNYLRQDMQHMLSDQQFSTVSLLAAAVNNALETRLEALKKTSEQISSMALADPVALQASLEQRTVFQSLFNGGTFITGMDGVAIASVPVSTGRIGISYIDRDYMLATLKEGKTTIGKPVIGRVLKTPIFVMATPLRDFDGKVNGALAGVIDLSKPNFFDQITQYHYGKTGGYFLVAPKYRLIVTATDRTRVMEKYPAPGILPAIDRFLQEGYKGGSSVYVNPLGTEVLGSAKTIPAAGWLMGAILPTEEAFTPIHAMQQRLILSALFVTLLAGGLTWWILSRQLAPMTVAARILDSQAYTNQPMKPLPISNSDEIGRLIGGFNRLLETLVQREEAVKRSEKKYRAILHTVMDGFWLADQQGRLLEVNAAYCRMSGYSAQELLNMHVSDLEALETAVEIATHIQWITLGGKPDRFETLHRRKDGSIFDVEVSAQFLPDGGGVVMVFLRDITAQKKTEKEFRLVFEQSRDAVIWADLDTGIITKVNAKAEDLTERAREELIGNNHTCLFPPEQDGEELFRRVTATLDGGIFEALVFTRSGRRIPVRISTTIVDLGARRVIQGIFQDITELKRAENALKASEERNRYIIDTSLEGIWIGDEMYQTTYVNKRFAQMLGYDQKEMLGRNGEDFVAPEQLSDHLDQVRMRRSGQEHTYERCLRKRDGEKIWTVVSARGIYNTLGQFTGSFGMFTDITARKQAEDALRASLAEKEILLREVHHRVKNNLAAIMGLVDIQGQSMDSESSRSALSELSSRIKSMSLVHEHLYQSENFSRIDFQKYLETLITNLRSSYQDNRDIHVSVNAQGIELGLDSAIPCGLIVTELVTNAYKYAFPESHPHNGAKHWEISVSIERDGSVFKLSVIDNGVGLPAETDWNTTKTMGLLLVRMLGEHQLQGRIEMDRTVGTMFRLRFSPMG